MVYLRDATEFETGSKEKRKEHGAVQPDQLINESPARQTEENKNTDQSNASSSAS